MSVDLLKKSMNPQEGLETALRLLMTRRRAG